MANDERETEMEIDPNEIWERQRRRSLRIFKILLFNGEIATIFAHYWDNATPGGHVNFYTIEPSGRHTIRNSFQGRAWITVAEIDDPTTDPAALAMGASAGVPPISPTRVH